jgi:S1-C subfamily serine protease
VTRRLALLLAAAIAAPGCGDGSAGPDAADEGGRPVTVEVTTTRVEIADRRPTPEGFDAEAIFARDAPGVVTIISVFDDDGDGPRGADRGGVPRGGVGSGFVISDRGEIATNAHVVTRGEGRDITEADEVYVKFADDNQVRAEIVGFDPNADVALLRLESLSGLTLRPLPLGSSRDVRVGQPVAAIGSPFGEEQSLSVGVVSATDRAIESLTGFQTLGAVQTDAAINQGNSGGPLLDRDGRVIGMNAQIRTTSGGGEGVGYAIPVDQVRRSIEQIRATGEARYAYLGVSTVPVYPQLARRFDLGAEKGAWVQEVVDGGPADEAGIRAGSGQARFQARTYRTGGDVITRVDGRAIDDENALGIAVAAHQPGDEVTIELLRDGERRSVKVRLGRRPAQVDGG